jgi:short-subunit dehydrogenase
MSAQRGETVLITGASSGIGKVTALYMAEKGYRVVGTSRSLARLTDLRAEASSRNLTIAYLELDINSDEAVGATLPRLMEEHGTIDVLVNNAGYGLWGPVEGLSMAELKAQFEANFFGAVRLINAVLPGMVRQRKGTIINVSSILGRMGTPFTGAYAASKFALEGLSESLRAEVWPLGVRVAVVEPGVFSTNFQKNLVVGQGVSSRDAYFPYIERYKARHQRFERLSGDPVKVAKVIYKIARSRRPAFRYPVGADARMGILGARVLPERLFQAMLSRATIR